MKTSEKIKETLRACPVCANKMAEVLHSQDFILPEGHPLPKNYDVVCCVKCGFVYADTPGTQAVYDRYYKEFSKYEEKSLATGGGATPLDAERLMRTADDIEASISRKDSLIVDIGCANGGLLAALSKKGYSRLAGADPSSVCVRAVEALGFKAYAAGLLDRKWIEEENLSGKFDVVILSHVLEHVRDLKSALQNVSSLLKEGGYLYAEVPDAASYARYFVVPYYYFDCEHINHFDAASLRALMAGAGFSQVKTQAKTLTVSANILYPAVFSIFKKDTGAVPGVTAQSTAVRESVLKFVSMSASEWPDLKKFAESGEEIAVWGAGQYVLRLLTDSPLKACRIACFVDKDSKKHGQKINGISVDSPEVLRKFGGRILICAALHSREILAEIRKMGLKNEVTLLEQTKHG